MVNFTVPADHWAKPKESKKRHFVWKLKKKQWNMKVTVIPIVIGTFGTITKGLVQGLEDFEKTGRAKTI